jgi:type IV pilus assembly protein PilW
MMDRPGSHFSMIGNERGFSLVELMAAVLITAVIVAAALTTVVSSNRANHVNSQVADTQQNVRVAMDLISKDIRLAGFNYEATDPATPLIVGCSSGGRPVGLLPQDQNAAGADTGPDRVSLVVPVLTSPTTPWVLSVLAAPTGPGSLPYTTVNLAGAAITDMQAHGFTNGSVVSLGGAVLRRVSSFTAGSITFDTGVDGTFPVGTPVYLMQCVQYQVTTSTATCGPDGAPCLVRNGIPVVDGVEDFQLSYACDGCNTASPNPLGADGIMDEWEAPANGFTNGDFISNSTWSGAAPLTNMRPHTIRLAQISIVARQTQADQGTSEGGAPGTNSPGPVVVGDHDPSTPGDPGYDPASYQQQRRRVLTRSVQPRNL